MNFLDSKINKIVILEKSNQKIKLEAQKRLSRDFGE